MRVEELPDEFLVIKNQLWCKWCDLPMNTLRKDNLKKHLHCKMHQGNRALKGAYSHPPLFLEKNQRKQRVEMTSDASDSGY